MSMIVDFPATLLQKAGVKNEKNAKLIVYSILSIVVVIGGVIIYKKVKNLFGGGTSQDEMQHDINNLDINNFDLTISEGEATIIASNLFVAMDRFGTDEQAILDAMNQLHSQADLMLVIKTFGIKLYSGLDAPKNFFDKLYSTAKNLQGWLRSELSNGTLEKVKEKFDNLGVPF